MNIKKIRNKIKNKLNSSYAIASIEDGLLDFNSEIINISYEDLLNFIKDKNIKFIKSEEDYDNSLFNSDLVLLNFKEKYISLFLIENKDYKLVEYVLNKFNTYEARITKHNLSNIVGVRWIGAFNTNTSTIKHTFRECLEWEWSKKDREVACDLFADFSNFSFINGYKTRKNKSTDGLYKRCKLAFVYNEEKIRRGYVSDVWSRQLGSMLVANNDTCYYADEVTSCEDLNDLNWHAEGFIFKKVQPDFILVVDKNKWQRKSFKVVENFAKSKNITIVYISSDFCKNSIVFDNIDDEEIKSDLNFFKKLLKEGNEGLLDYNEEYIQYLLEYDKLLTKYECYSNIDRLC